MAKNPVLPLYYNDIDRSTRDWTDEEFGAYMRLLMEQWDKGILPNDYQRLTRIATSLPTTWNTIKSKFAEVPGGLQNLRMEVIRGERLKFSEKQSDNVRKRYQTSTKPSTKTVPSYEDEHEIEIEDVLEKEDFGKSENLLIPKMLQVFKKHNPKYPDSKAKDFRPLFSIASYLCEIANLSGSPEKHLEKIIEAWDPISQTISKDKFYKQKSLSVISNQIQEITQNALYGDPKNNGKPNYGSQERAKELDRLFAERYGKGGPTTG